MFDFVLWVGFGWFFLFVFACAELEEPLCGYLWVWVCVGALGSVCLSAPPLPLQEIELCTLTNPIRAHKTPGCGSLCVLFILSQCDACVCVCVLFGWGGVHWWGMSPSVLVTVVCVVTKMQR